MSQPYSKISDNSEQPSLLGDDFIQPDDISPSPYNEPSPAPQVQPQGIKTQTTTDSSSHMFQINFYRKFFDVDSETFFRKIQRALNPLNPAFDDVESEVDELYGFFWITGTLIFLMFVSSTGSNILSQWIHDNDGEKYEYSFDLLTMSISLFYGYNILVPLILVLSTSFLLKFPTSLSLTKLISIYGYANILWIPITLINVLIVVFVNNKNHHLILNLLEWLVVSASGFITGLSNLSKIGPHIHRNTLLVNEGNPDAAKRQYILVMSCLGLAHLVFTMIVKISFFGIKV